MLAPEVLDNIEHALHGPEGFASYEALRQWVRRTHGVEVKHKTLYTLVRTRFHTKLKVARPSHTENPDAMAAFQAGCQEQLQRAIPPPTRGPSASSVKTKAASAY